jgi:6-phosphogluconolactonase
MTEQRFVFSLDEELWAECERLVRESVEQVSAQGYRAGLLVSGGSTFLPFYSQAADLPADLFPADERCVPLEDAHNTSGMLAREWADRFLSPQSVVRSVTQQESPQATAAAYAVELQQWNEQGGLLAAALLGVGTDGHVASLFPGQMSQWEGANDLVMATEPEAEPLVPRVTVTPHLLAQVSRHIVVLTGSSKSEVVARWLKYGHVLPCSIVQPGVERIVLMDDAAANQLPPSAYTRGYNRS